MWLRRSDPHRMAGRQLGREGEPQLTMRADLEKIVGAAALDERPVRDLWPLAIMKERAGIGPPRVLVARPSDREQVAAMLRLAAAQHVAVTPLGGGSGVC